MWDTPRGDEVGKGVQEDCCGHYGEEEGEKYGVKWGHCCRCECGCGCRRIWWMLGIVE